MLYFTGTMEYFYDEGRSIIDWVRGVGKQLEGLGRSKKIRRMRKSSGKGTQN
jgi:hypothetical protein